MSMPAARITDMHTCPMVTGLVPHVGGPIIVGSPNVITAHCLIHNVTGELTAMIVAARLNVVGVADGGTDQHECAAGDHGGCG